MSLLEETFIGTVENYHEKVKKGMRIPVTEGPKPSHDNYTEHTAVVLTALGPFNGTLEDLVDSIKNIKEIIDATVKWWDEEGRVEKDDEYNKNFALLSLHNVDNPLHYDPIYCKKGASFVLVVPDDVDENKLKKLQEGVYGVVDVLKYTTLVRLRCQYNFVFVHKDVGIRVEDRPSAFIKKALNVVFYLI